MPSWNWDEQADSEGMVHQSVANTDNNDATKLKQGYDYANFSEISPTPMACWPLHEDSGTTAYDVAGTNDGTVNGTTQGQTGLLGTTAYSFDGTDDYVNCPSITQSTLNGLSELTICVWVETSDSDGAIVSTTGGNDGNIVLRIQNDLLSLGVVNENGSWQGVLQYSLSSSLSHIAGVINFNTGSRYIYVDGSQVASDSISGTSIGDEDTGTDLPLNIGRQPDQAKYLSANVLADVRIYDTALTTAQHQTHYDVVRSSGNWLGTGKVM